MRLEFFVPGKPSPAGSKRSFTKGGRTVIVDACEQSKSWKESAREAALQAMNGAPPTRQPVCLLLTFTQSRPKSHFDSRGEVKPRYAGSVPTGKPDALKLARAVEDALSGIVYCDDAQAWKVTSEKTYGDRPGVRARVEWECGQAVQA